MFVVSFVIPIYRNAESIRTLVTSLEEIFISKLPTMCPKFILVNDGSDDDSGNVINALVAEGKPVTHIQMIRNFGQVNAIVAGLRRANGNATIVLSADMQEPVDAVVALIESWQKGNNVVIALRSDRSQESLITRISSKLFYGVVRIGLPEMPSGGFDFVLLDRLAVASLNMFTGNHRFLQADILWLGLKTAYVPYVRLNRLHGRSQMGFHAKVDYLFDALLVTSSWPVRLMWFSGGLLSLAGLFLILLCVSERPLCDMFTALTVCIGGMIILMIGVLGEYLRRIGSALRGRPPYIELTLNEK